MGSCAGSRYLATIDLDSEVPSKDLLPASRPRVAPYIYSPAEIAALMSAARALTPQLRAATCETVIGLMATSGLRLGEALWLDRQDVDLEDGALHVRARQSKQREVPLHHTATEALRDYANMRDRSWPKPATPAFFVAPQGGRLTKSAFNSTFAKLIGEVGLEGAGQRVRPRPHDLRHTLAVRTLLDWYLAGENVDRRMPLLHLPRPLRPCLHILVSRGRSGADGTDQQAARATAGAALMSLLAPTLQAWFTERLTTQRNSSPRTIASYRDTFRLLLAFATEQTGKQPSQLDIDDLDAPLTGAFLTHLEQERGNSISTRNARLAAIHSFHRYAALKHPEHVATIGRVMAIPSKRHQRNTVSYLNLKEIKALLRAPDRGSWLGRRDHAILLTAIQTGVRVTELVTLRIRDVSLSTGAHVRVMGKGRKERTTNLTPETVAVLRQWLKERQGQPDEPLFPTRQGQPLTRYGVGILVDKHTAAATAGCPSLKTKRVTPHVLRHTNAMLLRAGDVDIATIALWLGHESTKTTSIYEHADPALKERAIARIAPLGTRPGRYRPSDTLLAFLDRL